MNELERVENNKATGKLTRQGNIIRLNEKAVKYCCERMAKEIFDSPFKKYTYALDDDGNIDRYIEIDDNGSYQSLDACPFCRKKT